MAEKQTSLRRYTVCAVNGSTLTVLGEVDARRQKDACDQVVAGLPVDEQNGAFAAFLTGSYREFEYQTNRVVQLTKQPREPSYRKMPT